jgi:hypothetical protein
VPFAAAWSASEAALIVGRRGGKSRILALVAVFLHRVPVSARCCLLPEVLPIGDPLRGQLS